MKENIIEKEWKNSYQKKYYFKNRDKILEGQKKAKRDYYYRNKEKLIADKKIYRANNPEKVKKWRRTWYNKHKEEIALKAKLKRGAPIIKKCSWCLDTLPEGRTKFCRSRCNEKYKIYSQRRGPIWFWRFYTKYEIYKWIYAHFPKYKRILIKKIPKFFKKIFLKFKNKLGKLKTYYKYYHLYFEKTKLCNHWIFYISKGSTKKTKNIKNFCNEKCKQVYEQKIIENKKQRNLAAWGMEHRPDEETRRIINNKKHAEWDKQKKIDDPAHKLIRRMRLRTKKVLGANYRRVTRMTDVYTRLGINNGQELKKHLESKWKPGMNWDNYGKQDGWVIDHIIPLKYYKDNFDLANDIEIQKKAFGVQNLQPLWWMENAKKSAKLNYELK